MHNTPSYLASLAIAIVIIFFAYQSFPNFNKLFRISFPQNLNTTTTKHSDSHKNLVKESDECMVMVYFTTLASK